jgi:hypothetical protein
VSEEKLWCPKVQSIAALVEKKERAESAILDVHGEKYVRNPDTGALTKVEGPDYVPGVLKLVTLQSLIDYIRDNPDGEDIRAGGKRFVVIEGPTAINYGTGAGGPYKRRAMLARADAVVPDLQFGRAMSVEAFIVMLRTHFQPTDGVKALIDVFSHIDAQNSVLLSDDGLSQTVTVNRGVRGKEGARIPNPMPLQPHRTFSEVIQPETPFLIRLQGGGNGSLPTVTLTEADMGQWRLAAIANVKAKIVDSLPDVKVYG